jgi:hypothetical protein
LLLFFIKLLDTDYVAGTVQVWGWLVVSMDMVSALMDFIIESGLDGTDRKTQDCKEVRN